MAIRLSLRKVLAMFYRSPLRTDLSTSIRRFRSPIGGGNISSPMTENLIAEWKIMTQEHWDTVLKPYIDSLDSSSFSQTPIAVDHTPSENSSYTFLLTDLIRGACVLAPNGKIYSFGAERGIIFSFSEDGIYEYIDSYGGGGASGVILGHNDRFFCLPGVFGSFVEFDPRTDSFISSYSVNETRFGETMDDPERFYWGGGTITEGGIVYAMPGLYRTIARLDTKTRKTSQIDISSLLTTRYVDHYYGCALTPGGIIYAIPWDGKQVLRFETKDESFSLIGPDFGVSQGTQKWSGGVLAPNNGCIYGIPHNSSDILKIDPSIDEVTTISTDLTLSEGFRGGVLGIDGKIYCASWSADFILVIDPLTDTYSTIDISALAPTGLKSRGGVLTPNGSIHFIPAEGDIWIKLEASLPLEDKFTLSGWFNRF